MSDDDNDRGTLSNHSDSFLIPVTTDGTKLLWDGNAATILGLLYEIKRFFTRSGLFQMLISVRAVSLGPVSRNVQARHRQPRRRHTHIYCSFYHTYGLPSDFYHFKRHLPILVLLPF